MDYDVIIIGAGVIGLATAAAISEIVPGVAVIERHPSFGWETSSRNSEVIHAGIYYPTNSLKARLCLSGNKSLYNRCDALNIPYKKTGKFIIANGEAEEAELELVYAQALENGVEIARMPIEKFHRSEPNVKATAAIWSPTTGIIDTHMLMESFAEEAKAKGCDFAYKHTVSAIEPLQDGFSLKISDPSGEIFNIRTKFIINSAGLDSDTIAHMAGIDVDAAGLRLHYCRGHYFRLSPAKGNWFNHLIYPVPHKNITGLGIHATLDLGGGIRFGPDVQYLTNRLQDYNIPEGLQEKFYWAASKYALGLEIDDLSPDMAGIRPKLQPEGGDFRDFVIREESASGLPGLINLIGIESPGLTSCIEIAAMVERFIE